MRISPTSSPEFDLVIEAGRGFGRYWKDLWLFRGLFFFLAWRDVLVRYKQTVIGVAWAILRPLLTMVVFTVIFGRLAKLPSEGVPYPILVFAAMLPWQMFSSGLQESSESLLANAQMISKIYFPRIIVPTSAIAVSLVDFLFSFAILLGLMAWYGAWPSWRIATLPFFTLLALACALGAGFWFSSLSAKYRDFRYVVPFVVQFGLFVSPVGFSSTIVPEKWRLLYSLNPMVGVIDGFRWALLGVDTPFPAARTALSTLVVAVVFVTGFLHFRRTERILVDVI